MAKEKITADSFLFEANRGKKWNIIHRHFGNDGIVIWITLLQELCKSDHHYINANKVMIMELADLSKVSDSKIIEFMDFVAENFPDHFNNELWLNYRIIRNDKLIDQLMTNLYSKRTSKPNTIEQIKTKHNITELNTTKENKTKPNLTESNLTEPNITQLNLTKGKDRNDNIQNRKGTERGDSVSECIHNTKTISIDILPNAMIELIKSKNNIEFAKWYIKNLEENPTSIQIQARDIEGAYLYFNTKLNDKNN